MHKYHHIRASFLYIPGLLWLSVRLEETADSIVCKLKTKAKSEDINAIISVEEFLKSVEELYGLVVVKPGVQMPENVNMNADMPPRPEGENEPLVTDTSVVPFMVWGGTYFGVSDYSGFSRESSFYADSSAGDTFMDS